MTVATLTTAMSAENRKAVIAGTIGNVLEWYDFGVYGYFATTMSQLFFPGDDKTISLLKAFAVFGVGFIMRPVGSVLFGIYGDRFGRRLALSAVIFLMAFSTVAIGLLPTYAQAGVLAPILLVVFRLLQGLSAGGEWGGSTSYIVEYAPEGRRGFIGSWQQVSVGSGFLLGSLSAALLRSALSPEAFISWGCSSVPPRHSGRHFRRLSPLAAQRHAQVHRDRAAWRSRRGAVDRDLHQSIAAKP